ncbi:MAG TPA: BamA/TamA family outer membrane protein [Dongiaceae bacterium]|nr:BamA/TamA family outer membrane protein [Dongiaceae bacterium]
MVCEGLLRTLKTLSCVPRGICFWLLICSGAAVAEQNPFIDPEDGAVDLSSWLLDRKGFLPVPIIITEPAVSYGGGLALMFINESIGDAVASGRETGHIVPPDIYGAAAFGTENGTKGAAAGGMVNFLDDRYRWRGGVAHIDANLDFYGKGQVLGSEDAHIGYNLEGFASQQEGMWRIGDSNTWLVGRWVYLDFDSTFDLPESLTRLSDSELQSRSSGLGFSVETDARDNIFTPNRGWTGSIDATFYDPDWGSDERFSAYRAHIFAYYPLTPDWIFGGRLDSRLVDGDAPFYQLPFIDLRGVPAARYQDEKTGIAETEVRWNATQRWALVGFVGAGRAWGSVDDFSEAESIINKGGGFRYLIARALGLYVGLDYARGGEDEAFYIQVGNGWR